VGLRASEMHALALADMNWRCGEVIVHGKGGRGEANEIFEFPLSWPQVSDKRLGN